jgi:hypothetical protein
MSHKSRRRVSMAAGAILAGAAIPIAAGTAWAALEKSVNGIVVFDTFPQGPEAGTSDVGSAALSGTSNDTAIYSGPVADYAAAAAGAPSGSAGANDSLPGDAYDSVTATNSDIQLSEPVSSAYIADATGSYTIANGGGAATVEGTPGEGTVSSDHAIAEGKGDTAIVENDGGTGTLSGDTASAHDGGRAIVEELGGSGNMTYDDASASFGGTAMVADVDGSGNVTHNAVSAIDARSFAEVGNGYYDPTTGTYVDGGTAPVRDTVAVAGTGGTALIGEDSVNAAVHNDLAIASHDLLASLIDVSDKILIVPFP